MFAKKYIAPLVQDCMPLVKELGLTDTNFIFIVGGQFSVNNATISKQISKQHSFYNSNKIVFSEIKDLSE